jgi:hypothetical protein
MRAFMKVWLVGVGLIIIVTIFLSLQSSNNGKSQGTSDLGQGALDTQHSHPHHEPEETQDAADHQDGVKQQENFGQDVPDAPRAPDVPHAADVPHAP